MSTPSEQQKIIIDQIFLEETDILARLDFCNLISKDWWASWCRYVGFTQSPSGEAPGAITNESLLEEEGYAENIEDMSILVTTTVWSRLKSWYSGGPDVLVHIINCRADYTPVKIFVCESLSDTASRKSHWVSLLMDVCDLEKLLCQEHYIPIHKLKLSLAKGEYLADLATEKTQTLGSIGVKQGSIFVIEQKQDRIRRSASFGKKDGKKSPGNRSDTLQYYAEDKFDILDADFDLWEESRVLRTDTAEVRAQVNQAIESKKVKPRIKKLARTWELYNNMIQELWTKKHD